MLLAGLCSPGFTVFRELAFGLCDGIVGERIDQADFEGSLGVKFLGGDKEFQRSSLPNQAREALRSSPTCDQAKCGTAMAKDRAGRGDPAMAS